MAEADRTLGLMSRQRGELRQLARSSQREEADRARGILLTAEGWKSAPTANVLSQRPDGAPGDCSPLANTLPGGGGYGR